MCETPEYMQMLLGGQGAVMPAWMTGYSGGPDVSGLSAPSIAGNSPLQPQFWSPSNGVVTAPQSFMGKVGSWFSDGQNLGAAANAFGSLSSAYLGFQQLKQAKANLNFQKQAFDANLTNSIASYNTSLEDKIRGRTSDYQGKEADVQAYLAKHSLTKK